MKNVSTNPGNARSIATDKCWCHRSISQLSKSGRVSGPEVSQTIATVSCKTQSEYADQREIDLQNRSKIRRPARPWIAKHRQNTQLADKPNFFNASFFLGRAIKIRKHWNVQYSAPSHLGDAKHNVPATFMVPCAEHWNVQYSARSNSWSWKFAFCHSFARPTHRILRESSSSKMKILNASRYSSAHSKIQKCAFRYKGVRKNVWKLRFARVSRDRRTEPARGFIQQNEEARLATAARVQESRNVRFTTAAYTNCMKHASDVRGSSGNTYHFTTVLDVQRPRNDEMVARLR